MKVKVYQKEDVNKIWNLFLNNSYSEHNFKFGNNRIGYKDLTIKFNHINNYYSNIYINKSNDIIINIGIPTNGKEKRIKENISHESISSNNIEMWLNYWFKIFKRKSNIFIKNSERILKEIEKDWKMFESYVNNEYDNSKIIDYSSYISNFSNFKNKKN